MSHCGRKDVRSLDEQGLLEMEGLLLAALADDDLDEAVVLDTPN